MKTPFYSWILFDADETLFSFDAFKGLQRMFATYDHDFTSADYEAYQLVNKALWVRYQNNEITAAQLQTERFNAWSEKINVAAILLNNNFLNSMAEICSPLDGAVSLLTALKDKFKLGIITNGFTQLQQTRLEKTGLKEHFEFLVISEEVGIAKPNRGIFDHALNKMGNPPRDQVLMVGDTLESDILGGINAELHTCWLNNFNKPLPANIQPHYQVSSLAELQDLLIGGKLFVDYVDTDNLTA